MDGVDAKNVLKANIALMGTLTFWGTMIPAIDQQLPFLHPFLLSLLRYGISSIAMILLVWALEGNPFVGWAAHPWAKVWLLGALGMGGFTTFFTLGIAYSDPITAPIVMTAAPLITTLLARGIYRIPVQRGMGLALLCAMGGGVLVVSRKLDPGAGGMGLRGGEVFLLLAQVCWAMYTLAGQRWLPGYSALKITALTVVPGAAAVGLVFGVAWSLGHAGFPQEVPPVYVFALLFWSGLGGGGLAVLLWNFGARWLGAPVASLYLNLTPVIAISIAVLLGSPLHMEQVLGGLLIMVGVAQIQLRPLLAARLGRAGA